MYISASFTQLRKVTISIVLSVPQSAPPPSAWKNLVSTGRIFVKFYSGDFKVCREHLSLLNIVQKFQALYMKA
jgi:hypothetical protein